MLEYLRDYAEKFGLRKHIQLNTKVVMALPLADGKWELELATGEKRIYKGLIVATGIIGQAFSELSGKIRRPVDSFERLPESGAVAGKRVLVIGGGTPRAILRRRRRAWERPRA